MKMKKLIAFLLVIVFSFGAVAIGLRIGFKDVFRERGPEAALMMSQDDYFTHRDFKSLFGVAYSLYAKGEITQADGLVNKMMYQEEWVLNDHVKGNCLYLKGLISKKKGRFPEAISYFFRAKDLYQRLDLQANIYRVNLVTARVYLTLGDIGMVETILEESLTIAESIDISLAGYYGLWSEIATANSDWALGQEFAQKLYDEAVMSRDVSRIADAISELGFYQIVQGNFEEGYDLTMEAQRQILEIGDTDKYYYNLINLIIYERCSGQQLRSKVKVTRSIQNRLEDEPDESIRSLLEYATNFDCGTITSVKRKQEGDPSPPD